MIRAHSGWLPSSQQTLHVLLCPHLRSACSWPLSVRFKWCRVQRSLKAKMCNKNTALCTYVTPSKNKNLKVEQRGPAAFLLSANMSFTVPVMDWQKKHAPFWQHKQTFTNIKDLHSLPMKNRAGFCARRNPGTAPVHKHPTQRHSGAQLPRTPHTMHKLPVTTRYWGHGLR